MSTLYIKVEDGVPVGHPLLADNLRTIFETSTMTDAMALDYGYYPYENIWVPDTKEVIGGEGYEICDDGIVRPKLIIRDLDDEEKRDRFIRPLRDRYLFLSDWTQMADSPLSTAKKAEWAAYRQALRDLPSQYPNATQPDDVVWPEQPAK